MAELTLRPLGVGEIIDHSLAIYRRQFAALVTITLGANALPLVFTIYLKTAGSVLERPVLYGLVVLLSLALGALATATTVFLVSETYLGNSISAGQAFGRARRFAWRLILLTMMTSLVVGLVLVAFLLPGMIAGSPVMIALAVIPGMVLAAIVFTGLLVATPSLVVEDIPPTRALNRSWSLTRGSRWKMFGLLLVIGIILMIPLFAIMVLQGDLMVQHASGEYSTASIAWELAGQVVTALIYPLLYCALTVAYYDLRVRKEGFDLELLEQTLTSLPLPSGGVRELPVRRDF